MPHKSIRKSLGISPPDLYREPWHPDRYNLERQKCKVIRTEQKLLVCDLLEDPQSALSGTASALSSTSASKWPSLSAIRRLFEKRTQTDSGEVASCKDRPQPNCNERYKIVGKIYPEDKPAGVFKAVPASLMPLEPPSQCPSELIRDVQNYLRQRPRRQDWKIKGAMQKPGQAPSITSGSDGDQPLHSREPAITNDSSHQATHFPDASDQRRFVLLSRCVRCNCEESFYPRHRLQITYKPGYIPDPQKIAEAERRARSNATSASTAAMCAATACGAAAVVCAAGC